MIILDFISYFVFFQAEDGIRDLVRSRGLGDVYKRQENVFEHKKHETKNGVTTEFKKVEFRKIEPEKTKIFTPEDNGEPKENIFIKMKKFFNEF